MKTRLMFSWSWLFAIISLLLLAIIVVDYTARFDEIVEDTSDSYGTNEVVDVPPGNGEKPDGLHIELHELDWVEMDGGAIEISGRFKNVSTQGLHFIEIIPKLTTRSGSVRMIHEKYYAFGRHQEDGTVMPGQTELFTFKIYKREYGLDSSDPVERLDLVFHQQEHVHANPFVLKVNDVREK